MEKGFTVVELLVVIAIIAVIAVLVSTNMLGLQGDQQEKEYENYVMTIENAACVYIEKKDANPSKTECVDNKQCTVTIKTLVEAGLLDENLTNPKDNKKVLEDSNEININYSTGEKICKYE